jgi:hypothetical protein
MSLFATARCGGSSSSSSDRACVPGASVACVGHAGCSGFQVCDSTGASLGSCTCDLDASQGASSSGASGSGSSSGSSGATSESGSGPGADSGDASSGEEGGPADGSDGSLPATCRPGLYAGSLGGLYSSHLTVIGANIPVVADVSLTVAPLGSIQGVIQGTMDGLFPFTCSVTGTLDCANEKLADGWIHCTYCIGPINDGGTTCSIGADGGTIGTGGQFGGPLTADYFHSSTGGDGGAGAIDGGGSGPPAFGTVPPPLGADASAYDPGTWNGSEALGGYTGSGPLPDGGTLGDYLSDAGYGRIGQPNDFGGNGFWYATYQHP